MRLGIAILLLVLLAFFTLEARAQHLLRFVPTDPQPGDTYEVSWRSCETDPAYRPLEATWRDGEILAAVSDPAPASTAVVRTIRDGLVSPDSNAVVFTPEPPMVFGFASGLLALFLITRRRP